MAEGVMVLLKSFIKLISYTLLVYIAVMAFLTIKIDGDNNYTIYQCIANIERTPGGLGHTLTRYSEIDQYKNVDIVFIGSSHSYRGFDPRLFKECGYSTFNMGTTAQSPINAYFLLKRYFKSLQPKLVVLELFPKTLSIDGLESYSDIISNVSLSPEIVQMALSIKSAQALNLVTVKLLDEYLFRNTYQQKAVFSDTYVKGGFCETSFVSLQNDLPKLNKSNLIVNKAQVKYLLKIIEYIKNSGANVVIVIQPVTKEYIDESNNYTELSKLIFQIAAEYSVPFINYDTLLNLDTNTHFRDFDHLNQRGVVVTNKHLITYIEQNDLVHKNH
jgi:hypothetical protein